MANQNQYTCDLFAVIPPALRTPEQVPRWQREGEIPTYRLLRKPFGLKELELYNYDMAIWSDNGTLTYVVPHGDNYLPYTGQEFMSLSYKKGPSLYIVGRTKRAAVKTAAFFLSLEEPSENIPDLYIRALGRDFDFSPAGSRCLKHLLKVAPLRRVEFSDLKLSVQQCIALATRPHPIKLIFWDCEFEDRGTALVDALAKRQSSFGSLTMQQYTELHNDNVRRLLQLETIECLGLGLSSLKKSKLALRPFSAKVDYLEYEIASSSLRTADLESLNIVTNKLALAIEHPQDTFPTDPVLSFFGRIAELGHFEELKIRFDFNENVDIPESVVTELIRAALANGNLKVLDLSIWDVDLDWSSHLSILFEGLKDHKGLRTLKVTADDEDFGPGFCRLERLLSYNRYMTVTDGDARVYSDGYTIDKLYSLNRFYRGSADLMVEPRLERPLLLATALVQSASGDFRRSALLLVNHVDILCEYVLFAALDEQLVQNDVLSQPIYGNILKRSRRTQPPRAAKRKMTSST